MMERRLLILDSFYPYPKETTKRMWRVTNLPGQVLYGPVRLYGWKPAADCEADVIAEVTKTLSFLATSAEW
jgi:hypothetical protein